MNSNKQTYLFKDKRFLPLFIVQFLGCLNDSSIKHAVIMMVVYKLSNDSLYFSKETMVLFANFALIAPFFIFASIAGQVADRFERTRIVQIVKFVEILIIMFAIYNFKNQSIIMLIIAIFLMGVHSTFFGPIKYSSLPDQLEKKELLGANGFIEAGTFLAILFGNMLGGFYTIIPNVVMAIIMLSSIGGFIASLYMPKVGNSNPDIKINFNIPQESINIVKYAMYKKQVYLAILGISWFWFIGAAILTQIPMLTKDTLGADEYVMTLFLIIFSVGVGVGSFWCNRVLANEITTKYVFISALGISFFCIDLYFATRIAEVNYQPEQLKGILDFLVKPHYLRILFDLFIISAISGLYVVPLFAVMQYFTSPAYRSRVIAANNLINSIFMAASSISLCILFYLGFSIPAVILIVGILNLVIASHIYNLVPNSVIFSVKIWATIIRFFLKCFYKIEIKGQENLNKMSKRTVVIINHLSYLEPTLVAVYVSHHLRFAINVEIAEKWWIKPFLKLVKTFPVDPLNPMAIKSLISQVKQNRRIAIFPEGRISTTGSLMKIYEGSGMIADKADAAILPIAIRGTEFTCFSKMKHLIKPFGGFRQKITIEILPPVKLSPPIEMTSKQRRKYFSMVVYDLMRKAMYQVDNPQITIYDSLIKASNLYGKNTTIFEDADYNSETYQSTLLKTFILAELLKQSITNNSHITNQAQNQNMIGNVAGLMIPTMVGGALSFYATHLAGIVPAMINYTAGPGTILISCQLIGIKQVYTSRKFVTKGKLEPIVNILEDNDIKVIYLEDLRAHLNTIMKVKALLMSFFPQSFYNKIKEEYNITPDSSAVILFTSGSEGAPKGVLLSHKNLLANRAQVISHMDFGQQDSALNTLPLFHCFGLTAKIIMASYGIKTFFYPSPLHYRLIPEVIYNYGLTIMFSTDTFLNGYAAYATHYDLYSMKYVIAGAEKLKESTRSKWLNKFGIRILEGYGLTEASPVVTANSFMYYKEESVGRFLTNIEHFIKPVDGITEGGLLYIKGPNIMQGYVKSQGTFLPTSDPELGKGWYNTGDIVKIDDNGYVTIIGRQKRFAKIGGEMISLYAVENIAIEASPNQSHAAVALEDVSKGERIILLTDDKNLNREKMNTITQRKQLSELFLPSKIIYIEQIPLLGSGKIDYMQVKMIASKA